MEGLPSTSNSYNNNNETLNHEVTSDLKLHVNPLEKELLLKEDELTNKRDGIEMIEQDHVSEDKSQADSGEAEITVPPYVLLTPDTVKHELLQIQLSNPRNLAKTCVNWKRLTDFADENPIRMRNVMAWSGTFYQTVDGILVYDNLNCNFIFYISNGFIVALKRDDYQKNRAFSNRVMRYPCSICNAGHLKVFCPKDVKNIFLYKILDTFKVGLDFDFVVTHKEADKAKSKDNANNLILKVR